MIYLLLPLGLLLPTLSGRFVIKLLEQNHPVLQGMERWVLSVVFGITMMMFFSFIAELLGLVPFNLTGLLGVQIVSTLGLWMVWMRCKLHWSSPVPAPVAPSRTSTRWMKVIVLLLCLWTIAKIIGGFVTLIGTPIYEDDAFKNWNMRGKQFFLTQELTLENELEDVLQGSGGISSYPITVPLTKTWLATLAGEWHEGLANSIHIVWFIAALLLVFFTLRRKMSVWWALFGAYALSSLPLYFLHGTTAYADVFLSVHVFAVLSLLLGALQCSDSKQRLSFLRLSALAAGLLVFTKNEALIMHLPVLIILILMSLRFLYKSEKIGHREAHSALLHYLILIGLILVPWVLFKWAHNLNFGNAKSVLDLNLSWQEGVAKAIAVNTFLEGNWILLFPLLIGILFIRRKEAFQFPNIILSAFVLLIVLGQFPLYFFTGISTEALNQTGYARGLVQIAPVAITLLMLLVHSWLSPAMNEQE